MKEYFKSFYLDKEKDMIVDLYKQDKDLFYILRTPNHHTGNLIRNLSILCELPLSNDENGLYIMEGKVPCYVDGYNKEIYIFRLGNTKVANIYPNGDIEMKAQIPSISKTLMSQTKDYRLDIAQTIVKTYIRSECKFRTDLHTHMNANLKPDILIALGIFHQIQYPYYYIKKLDLRCSESQTLMLEKQREKIVEEYKDSGLKGKYFDRKVDDHTFINFADFILNNLENADYNISRIRNSLAVLKDGQAVFTNLEKVYLYRYVFTKGQTSKNLIDLENVDKLPNEDVKECLKQMIIDHVDKRYYKNTLFQNKLLWIAREYKKQGILYAEISDTTLVKKNGAAQMLEQIHQVMPYIYEETGVLLRFLAAIRRIPLTIVKDKVVVDYFRENLQVLEAVCSDPYVAGSDILGEEINDICDIQPVIQEIVRIAKKDPSFVVRIHAGENDGLKDNVANSIQCVLDSLEPGQRIPRIRIGHGLYTANLKSEKGRKLIRTLKETGAVLEFQISSNVRLNNLSSLENHPLKEYLRNGLNCVQGTDGGSLYGTDSIDEQLSLEKLLGLCFDELKQMRDCEDRILEDSFMYFKVKQENMKIESSVEDYYQKCIEQNIQEQMIPLIENKGYLSEEILKDKICALPMNKLPIVLMGGSFNSDQHKTVIHPKIKSFIDYMLMHADEKKVYFVIGHTLSGYEKYLMEQNKGKFEVFSFVPAKVSMSQARKLKKAPVSIRVSIETVPMGLYKSVAYEVFKRRPSVLLALDGNSSGINMIQEAKNSKYTCRIYVNSHSKLLRRKATSLEGYVTVLKDDSEEKVFREIENKLL